MLDGSRCRVQDSRLTFSLTSSGCFFYLFLLVLQVVACPGSSAIVVEGSFLKPSQEVESGAEFDSISVGGRHVAAGSVVAIDPRTGFRTGAVIVWDHVAGREVASFFPPLADSAEGMAFGSSIAISGAVMAVGAPGANSTPSVQDRIGAVYLIDLNLRRFIGGKIQPGCFHSGIKWGKSLDLDGDTLVVGSSGAVNQSGLRTGAVYIRFLGQPSAEWFLTPDMVYPLGWSGNVENGSFGASVAASGRRILVGAPSTSYGATSAVGVASLIGFDPRSSRFGLLAQIENPDWMTMDQDASGDGFGASVMINDTSMVVGSSDDSELAASGGAVFAWDIRNLPQLHLRRVVRGELERGGWGSKVMLSGDRFYWVDGSGLMSSFGLESWSGPDLELPRLPNSIAMSFHSDASHGFVVQTDTYTDGVPGVRVLSVEGSLMANAFPRVSTGSLADYESASTFQSFTEVVCASAWTGPDGLVGFAHSASLGQSGGARVGSRGLWKLGGDDTSPLRVVGEETSLVSFIRPLVSSEGCLYFLQKNSRTGIDRLWWADLGIYRFGPALESAHSIAMTGYQSVGEIYVDPVSGSNVVARTKRKLSKDVMRNNDSAVLALNPSVQPQEQLKEGDYLGADLVCGEIGPSLSFGHGKCSSLIGLTGVAASSRDNQAALCDKDIVVRKGSLAPGVNIRGQMVGDCVYRTFLSTTHFGETSLVRATAGRTGSSAVYEGIWIRRNNEHSILLQKGSFAPWITSGATIKRIVHYGLISEQDVVLLVQLTGVGINANNDQVVYLNRVNEFGERIFEVICREGDRLPGGKKVGTILKLDCTVGPGGSQSRYGLLCSLGNEANLTSPADNLAWLTGDFSVGGDSHSALRAPRIVLLKGSACHGNGPGYERVLSFSFPATLSDASGVQNSGLADVVDPREGKSVGVIKFPNGRSVICSMH